MQTLAHLQLFLVLKYTMVQETSTNLHKLYMKHLLPLYPTYHLVGQPTSDAKILHST